MPKMKTHSGAKKRFRVTGKGKLMREQANRRHLLRVQVVPPDPPAAGDVDVAPADVRKIKKLLGR